MLYLVLNTVFIFQYGLVGAAIGTTVSFLINTVLHTYFLNNYIKIAVPIEKIGWISLSSLIMGICVYNVNLIINPTDLFSLVLVIIVGIAAYSVVLLIPHSTRSELLRIFPMY